MMEPETPSFFSISCPGQVLSALPWYIILAFKSTCHTCCENQLYARYPAKLWQYEDCRGYRVEKVGNNSDSAKKHITTVHPGGICKRLQVHRCRQQARWSKAVPSGQGGVKDISCWSQSAVYHCKVTFIQFLFIWERRQKSILEQVVFSGGYQSSCSPFQNTQEPPLWLHQIPYDRAHCTRSLSFLARGIAAILNFSKLDCLMIFYNAELNSHKARSVLIFPIFVSSAPIAMSALLKCSI